MVQAQHINPFVNPNSVKRAILVCRAKLHPANIVYSILITDTFVCQSRLPKGQTRQNLENLYVNRSWPKFIYAIFLVYQPRAYNSCVSSPTYSTLHTETEISTPMASSLLDLFSHSSTCSVLFADIS